MDDARKAELYQQYEGLIRNKVERTASRFGVDVETKKDLMSEAKVMFFESVGDYDEAKGDAELFMEMLFDRGEDGFGNGLEKRLFSLLYPNMKPHWVRLLQQIKSKEADLRQKFGREPEVWEIAKAWKLEAEEMNVDVDGVLPLGDFQRLDASPEGRRTISGRHRRVMEILRFQAVVSSSGQEDVEEPRRGVSETGSVPDPGSEFDRDRLVSRLDEALDDFDEVKRSLLVMDTGYVPSSGSKVEGESLGEMTRRSMAEVVKPIVEDVYETSYAISTLANNKIPGWLQSAYEELRNDHAELSRWLRTT